MQQIVFIAKDLLFQCWNDVKKIFSLHFLSVRPANPERSTFFTCLCGLHFSGVFLQMRLWFLCYSDHTEALGRRGKTNYCSSSFVVDSIVSRKRDTSCKSDYVLSRFARLRKGFFQVYFSMVSCLLLNR